MTDHDTAPGPMSAEPDAIELARRHHAFIASHKYMRGVADDHLDTLIKAYDAAIAERDAALRHFETACSEIDRLENEDEKAKRIVELEKALNECNAYDAPAEVIALRSERDAARARLVEVEAGIDDLMTEFENQREDHNGTDLHHFHTDLTETEVIERLQALLADAAPSGTTGGGA